MEYFAEGAEPNDHDRLRQELQALNIKFRVQRKQYFDLVAELEEAKLEMSKLISEIEKRREAE